MVVQRVFVVCCVSCGNNSSVLLLLLLIVVVQGLQNFKIPGSPSDRHSNKKEIMCLMFNVKFCEVNKT